MNYKYLFKPLGVTSQRFKCNLGPFASFVGGAFNTIMQQKTNDDNISAQKEINKQNIQNQWNMFRAQNSRQDYLNANQDLIKRQSLQRAGLNLWSEFGGNPNISTNSISQPEQKTVPKIAPQMSTEFAQMLQQQPLLDAQAELTKQKAEEQEILNRRMRIEDLTHEVEDIIEQWNKNNEGKKLGDLPDIPVIPHNSGWFKAMRERNQFKGEQQAVEIQFFENDLRRLVLQNQIASPEVVNAFVKMPLAEKSRLISEAKLAIANSQLARQKKEESFQNTMYISTQDAYLQLKKQIESDNNLLQYVHKMFSGDFGFEDAVKMLVLVAVMQMSK